MDNISDREVITEKQENDFLEATMNICSWEDVICFLGKEVIPVEDITYEDAMYLLTTENYIACPF